MKRKLEDSTMAYFPSKKISSRSKMEDTPHPVYRGVKRRGASERWVCEIREPRENKRIPLGAFQTADMAARAHDVAVLALGVRLDALNFPDSKWLFRLPSSYKTVKDLQLAAVEAAELFRPREEADFAEDARSSTSSDKSTEENEVTSLPSSDSDNPTKEMTSESSSSSGVTSELSTSSEEEETSESSSSSSSEVVYDAMLFDLEKNGEMNLWTYYASLAEALLMEPPVQRFWGDWEDEGCGIEDTLWSS
ncbi:hypothetical protein LUZ60_011789 [Juncus effusus]|nr:hypothetical protein LUZ60_011789 [Juncus effusus]